MTDLSCRTMDSPRFEHSTLCYYVGDTFQLLLPIKDNTITIDWDADMTAMFCRGWYSYRIRYNGENVTTIAADCRINVQ